MRSHFALFSLSILISSVADYAQATKACEPCRGRCAAAIRPDTSLNQNHDTEADCIAFLSGSGSIPEYVTGKCRSEHKYSSACSCLAHTDSTTSLATTVSPASSVLTTPGISSTQDTSPSVSGSSSSIQSTSSQASSSPQSTPISSSERTTPSTLPTTPVTSTPASSGTVTVSSELASTPSSEPSTPSESSTPSASTTSSESTSASTTPSVITTASESTTTPDSTSTPESTTSSASTSAADSTTIPQSTTLPESTAPESTTSSTSTSVTIPTAFPRLIGTDVNSGASRELKLVKSSSSFYLSYAAAATQYAPANGVPYVFDPVTGRLSITLSPGLSGATQTYWFTFNVPIPTGSGYLGQWMLASDIAATPSKRYVRCTRNTSGQLICLSEADQPLLFLHTLTAFTVYIGLPPAVGNSVAMTLSLPLD